MEENQEYREGRVTENRETSTLNIEQNVASLLAYLGNVITGIIFIIIEKENKVVRFHAFQSTFTFGTVIVVQIALFILTLLFAIIPVIGVIVSILIGIMQFAIGISAVICWIYLMVKAYGNEKVTLPVFGKLAEKQVNK